MINVVGTTNGGTKWEWQPSQITVRKGEHVVFHVSVPAGDATHGFSIVEFGINQAVSPGQSADVDLTPDRAGPFSYFCSVSCGAGHSGMRGTLVVTDS